jgi:hypothetical protein
MVLLDALEGVDLTDAEQGTLEWLAREDHETVTNIAAMITRARLISRETLRE